MNAVSFDMHHGHNGLRSVPIGPSQICSTPLLCLYDSHIGRYSRNAALEKVVALYPQTATDECKGWFRPERTMICPHISVKSRVYDIGRWFEILLCADPCMRSAVSKSRLLGAHPSPWPVATLVLFTHTTSPRFTQVGLRRSVSDTGIIKCKLLTYLSIYLSYVL